MRLQLSFFVPNLKMWQNKKRVKQLDQENKYIKEAFLYYNKRERLV